MPALTFDDLLDEAPPPSASLARKGPLTFDDLLTESNAPENSYLRQAKDIGRAALSGLDKGVAGIAGLPADAARLAVASSDYVESLRTGRAYEEVRDSRDAKALVPSTTLDNYGGQAFHRDSGLAYEPQTAAGRATETVTSFVPGAVVMGPAGLARGAVAGVAAPAAGTFAAQGANSVLGIEGTPAALLEGAGALAGGVGGMVALRPRSAAQVVSQATGDLDPVVYQQAQALMDDAAKMGVRLTGDEAIQQVTGGATRLSELRRVVESSRGGGDVLKPMMAERPAQVQAAGRSATDALAPEALDPTRTGIRTQEAANGALLDAERARTAATAPLYQSAANDRVPVEEMENLLSSIERMAATDKTGLVSGKLMELRNLLTERPGSPAVPGTPATRTPVTGPNGQVVRYETTPGTPDIPEIPRVPLTDIENLDRVRKAVRDKVGAPQIGEEALTKEQAAALTGQLGNLRQTMVNASPDFAQAKSLYGQITQDVVEPLQRGPLGGVAGAENVGSQSAALLPTKPVAGAEAGVAEAVKKLATKDPVATQNLIRSHVRSAFDEATQDLASGANQFGGSKFASVVAGNSQQSANLEAAIRALPQGDMRWQGFRKFLDVMEATGKRPNAGSNTSADTVMRRDLSQGGMAGDAIQAARTGGTSLIKRFNEFKEQMELGRNTAQIANILTRPDAAKVLGQLARTPPDAQRAQILALRLSYMGRQGSSQND